MSRRDYKSWEIFSDKIERESTGGRNGHTFGFTITDEKPRIARLEATSDEFVETFVSAGNCLYTHSSTNSFHIFNFYL